MTKLPPWHSRTLFDDPVNKKETTCFYLRQHNEDMSRSVQETITKIIKTIFLIWDYQFLQWRR